MIPVLIGAQSLRALAIGARQLVVQDAAEIILSSFVRAFMVYIVNDGRKVITSRCGNDNVLSASIDMSLSFSFGGVETGTLKNNVLRRSRPTEVLQRWLLHRS